MLLSFEFASDVDMGLDPLVELVESTEDSFYYINVNDAGYKTLAILQDHRPDALLGRGARVFKVKRVGDPYDQIHVLKDFWLKKNWKPEHQIYEEIVEDVGRLYSEKDANSMKQCLLTPLDNAIVKSMARHRRPPLLTHSLRCRPKRRQHRKRPRRPCNAPRKQPNHPHHSRPKRKLTAVDFSSRTIQE